MWIRRMIVAAFWGSVVVAYVAAILPQAEAPHLGASDKIDHMAAFFVICFLGRLAFPGWGTLRVLAFGIGFGALIELTQMLPMLHRDAELGDWLADVVASGLGVLAAWPILARSAAERPERRPDARTRWRGPPSSD